MDTLDDFDTASIDDELYAKRDIIRESLNELSADIGMAMRAARLDFPGRQRSRPSVYFPRQFACSGPDTGAGILGDGQNCSCR